MALSGTLQDFAGGVLIFLLKPVSVGDLIKDQGHIGKAKEIEVCVTSLLSLDNKTILLPNGSISMRKE
jgi:small conductance mechanosensitive channel